MEFIYKNIKSNFNKEENSIKIFKGDEIVVWMFLENENGKLVVNELNNGFEYSYFGWENKEKYNEEDFVEIYDLEDLEKYDSWEDIVKDFVDYFEL